MEKENIKDEKYWWKVYLWTKKKKLLWLRWWKWGKIAVEKLMFHLFLNNRSKYFCLMKHGLKIVGNFFLIESWKRLSEKQDNDKTILFNSLAILFVIFTSVRHAYNYIIYEIWLWRIFWSNYLNKFYQVGFFDYFLIVMTHRMLSINDKMIKN